MASSKLSSACLLHLIFLALVFTSANGQGLKVGFYDSSCPNAEAIVKKVIDGVMEVAPSLAGPLVRLHFHDCFVRGCEGSVLLDSPLKQAEKDAPPNLSLRGYNIIEKVKTALEKACPGIVSCADIAAIVARDVTVASKGPFWQVETGRRDGIVSNASETRNNLPPPFADITTLKAGFQAKGLSIKDLVVLSGAHTIGTSHCSSFDPRIYNFTGKGDTDPTIDPNYVLRLKSKCKQGDLTTLAEMDPGSFKTFDTSYYKLVAKRRGLFQSDPGSFKTFDTSYYKLDDPETKTYVLQASAGGSTFFKDFGVSMVNMGRVGVLTGNQGEIRKVCSKIN